MTKVEALPERSGYLDFNAYIDRYGAYGRAEGGYHFKSGSVYGFAEMGYAGNFQYQAGVGLSFRF